MEAARLLPTASSVLLTTHVNPDGDAIGSVLALAHALRSMGLRVDVVTADPPPTYCQNLPGVDWITSRLPTGSIDLAVVCDAAGVDRIGPVEAQVRAARKIIEIDHHSVARAFGQVRIVDDRCFATAELIYYLLHAMNVLLTREIATNLMMGIVTDTGAFRFSNVTPQAFRIAAMLMEAGADVTQVVEEAYEQKSLASLKLLERAISHLKIHQGYASTCLSKDDFEQAGASQSEAEGIVGHLRSLKGVDIAAVLRETGPSEVRVSLRGRPGYNVAEIASRFGGGGHAAAAGCTIYRELEQADKCLRHTVCTVLGRAWKQD